MSKVAGKPTMAIVANSQLKRGLPVEFNTFAHRVRTLMNRRAASGVGWQREGESDSVVTDCTEDRVYYRSGSTTKSITIRCLYEAYRHFRGHDVYTADLKVLKGRQFAAFCSMPCNRAFFFRVLREMGLVTLNGTGGSRDPYWVSIPV